MNVFGDASARASTDFGYGRAAGTVRRRVRTWSRVLVVVLITALTSVVLLTGAGNISTFGLLGIVAASTAIWLLALWGVAARARARGLDALTAAAIGTATGMALLAGLDIFFVEGTIAPVELVVIAGGFFLLASALEGVTSIPLRRRPRVVFVLSQSIPVEFEQIRNGVAGRNFDYVGVVSDHEASINGVGMRRLGRSSDLVKVVRSERPDLVVVPNQQRRTAVVGRLLNGGDLGFGQRLAGLLRTRTTPSGCHVALVVHERSGHQSDRATRRGKSAPSTSLSHRRRWSSFFRSSS